MPIYEFICSDCGELLELHLQVSNRDKPVGSLCPKSPTCGGTLTRQISNTSFRLDPNGSVGWASNGYSDNVLGNDPKWRKESYGK